MSAGASTCSSCSNGKFQDNTGTSSCKACADKCAYGSSLSPCTAASNLMCLCSNGVCYKSTFNFSGRDQIWTVPAGVSSAQVKLWAAGGGGGRDHGCRFDGGGGGSSIIATLSGLTSFQNLTVVVGQGGFRGAVGSSVGENPYGGGGKRGCGANFGLIDNLQNGGAGGGRSEIGFAGRKIVVAGAGGGTLALCNTPLAALLEATGQMAWVGTAGVLVWVGKNSLEVATVVALISHQLLGNLE